MGILVRIVTGFIGGLISSTISMYFITGQSPWAVFLYFVMR